MLFHDAHFLFQFQRVCPEVITRTIGNVLSLSRQDAVEVIVNQTFVLLVGNQSDDVWMLIGIVLADGQCAIRRAVFA